MQKFSSPRFKFLIFFIALLDLCCLESALLMGYWLWVSFPWHGHYQSFSEFSLIFWILPPIGLIVFKTVGLYKPEMGVIGVEEQSLLFKAVWIIYFLTFTISFFYREVAFSRLAIFYSIFFVLFFITLERYFVRRFLEHLHKKGLWVRKALIYGAGYHGQRLERWIRQSPQLGIQVVGYLDDAIERLTKKSQDVPWLGGLDQFRKIAAGRKISILFIAHRKIEENLVMEIFQLCRDTGTQCWIIPSFYRFHVERVQLTNVGGIPLVGFREQFGRKSYFVLKQFLDICVFLLLLPLAIPLALVIAALVGLSSGRPIFFKQIRVGYGGEKFTMYKFRTLKSGSPEADISPELQKAANMIRFGLFLRRAGLDELPQLINVLQGHMSLVGPRPEMPFLAEKYGPLERERLTVKPGITGLWQISEDRKRLLIHENMDYDLYYVEHFSFNLDLAIFMKTLFVILKRISR